MTPIEFRLALARAGYSQRGFARYVGSDERTVRRWARGDNDIPGWVPVMFLHLPTRVPAERKEPSHLSPDTSGDAPA